MNTRKLKDEKMSKTLSFRHQLSSLSTSIQLIVSYVKIIQVKGHESGCNKAP